MMRRRDSKASITGRCRSNSGVSQATNGFLAKSDGKDKLTALVQVLPELVVQ